MSELLEKANAIAALNPLPDDALLQLSALLDQTVVGEADEARIIPDLVEVRRVIFDLIDAVEKRLHRQKYEAKIAADPTGYEATYERYLKTFGKHPGVGISIEGERQFELMRVALEKGRPITHDDIYGHLPPGACD